MCGGCAVIQNRPGEPGPEPGVPGPAPGVPGADRRWLAEAIRLSGRCEPSESAFCVGAVLVGAAGQVLGRGYSRQADPHDHAEEVALRQARACHSGDHSLHLSDDLGDDLGGDLVRATLYSSLEPCLRRVSRSVPCAELVLGSGIRRVVIAWLEPPIFQPGGGAAWLAERGVEVIELADLAPAAQAVNRALLDRH